MPSKTKSVTLQICREKDARIRKLAAPLELTNSKIYAWLVSDALQIVEDENSSPDVPQILSVLRGIHRKHEEMKNEKP